MYLDGTLDLFSAGRADRTENTGVDRARSKSNLSKPRLDCCRAMRRCCSNRHDLWRCAQKTLRPLAQTDDRIFWNGGAGASVASHGANPSKISEKTQIRYISRPLYGCVCPIKETGFACKVRATGLCKGLGGGNQTSKGLRYGLCAIGRRIRVVRLWGVS